MVKYKIDYERINQIKDLDKRLRILRQAKERIGELSLEEGTFWFENWAEAYFKSRAFTKARQSLENYARKCINRQARKKIGADPKFNIVKINRSAYEKAKYISKRVIELKEKDLEIKLYPISDKASDVISDFYIPLQKVNGVSCWTNSGAGVSYAHSIGKESYGWAHSHANMSPFHSTADTGSTRMYTGYESVLDICNDKEKNNRLNFRAKYIPSIVFNAKMIDDSNIKPFVGIGIWLDKLDEKGGRKRNQEFIFNSNVHLEIIGDNKEIDKKFIDQEISDKVHIYRNLSEVLKEEGLNYFTQNSLEGALVK